MKRAYLPVLLLAFPVSAPGALKPAGAEPDVRAPGQYVVTLDPEAAPGAVLERAFGSLGIKSWERLEVSGAVFRIRLRNDPGPDAIKRRAREIGAILRVQPDFRYSVPRPPGPGRPAPYPHDN